MDTKTFALAAVKALDSTDEFGEFEAILSAPTLDRDGEVIVEKAFEPLPASIPVHAFHDFNDPIGRGIPEYRDGVLYLRGRFASTPRAQEIRTLVAEGVIANMSVGFMYGERDIRDGVPHITKGEILEGSFVSIPSNRESAVLMAKEYEGKAGARNSSKDAERLQQIHDLAVANGAKCAHDNVDEAERESTTTDPEEKAAATAAANPPADVEVARAIAGLAAAEAHLLLTS